MVFAKTQVLGFRGLELQVFGLGEIHPDLIVFMHAPGSPYSLRGCEGIGLVLKTNEQPSPRFWPHPRVLKLAAHTPL